MPWGFTVSQTNTACQMAVQCKHCSKSYRNIHLFDAVEHPVFSSQTLAYRQMARVSGEEVARRSGHRAMWAHWNDESAWCKDASASFQTLLSQMTRGVCLEAICCGPCSRLQRARAPCSALQRARATGYAHFDQPVSKNTAWMCETLMRGVASLMIGHALSEAPKKNIRSLQVRRGMLIKSPRC